MCMKHINLAMEKRALNPIQKDESELSILERIIDKTGDPKIAAVLALDLFFVGVDTVIKLIPFNMKTYLCLNLIIDICRNYNNNLSIKSKS